MRIAAVALLPSLIQSSGGQEVYTPVPAPDAAKAATIVTQVTAAETLQLPYDPTSGRISTPAVRWKTGVNGYTIFTLEYAEVLYKKGSATADLTAGFPCKADGAAGACADDAASVAALNAHLVIVRNLFAGYAGLDHKRASCVESDDPLTGDCLLDLWRVKVFVPFTRGNLAITVHIAPPAAILDRPATVVARLDPARAHTGPRGAKSGPLQVSIAGGDWGYVCDERGHKDGDVDEDGKGDWFGDNDRGAQLACKQMFGLAATGTVLPHVHVAGAGENMALHRIACDEPELSTRGMPVGLGQCANTLPAHAPGAWGLMHATTPYRENTGIHAFGETLAYPATPEVCSDTEVAAVLCTFPNACDGHHLRSKEAAVRQPKSFCAPPAGRCAPGEWEIPPNGRTLRPAHAHHLACCATCPGGAGLCYDDCTCVCQTAKSCGEVQPMQKNCQTSVAMLGDGDDLSPDAEYKIGCRWDGPARGCVDFSASPTTAPTPQPTASPTANPTMNPTASPPTKFPTMPAGFLGGDAVCILGFYPMWYTEAAAKAASLDEPATAYAVVVPPGSSHRFYMANVPAGGRAWFGDYIATDTAHPVECIAPRVPTDAPASSGCADIKIGGSMLWKDTVGGTCDDYKLNAAWCERFGSLRDYSHAGLTASKACCVCGGGSTASPTPPPTALPTPPPTMAPTTASPIPSPTLPPPTDMPTAGCRFKGRDGIKRGKLGRACWDKCPGLSAGIDKCTWCGDNGVCCKQGVTGPNCNGAMGGAAHVCTCPSSLPLAGAAPAPVVCATKRAKNKEGKPCLAKCLKMKYWGGLPPADNLCGWCGSEGSGACVMGKGEKHRCACVATKITSRAAAALQDDANEEDDGEE